MFTNYKIFLDNDIDNKDIDDSLKLKLDTLCTAAKDTAEFTESISSTSTNKEVLITKSTPQEVQEGHEFLSKSYPELFSPDVDLAIDVNEEPDIDVPQDENIPLDANITSDANEEPSANIPLDENTVGGKRKFNMNQLIEYKNKKSRTHRNLSSKNKKNKVFYNRTKKNT